MSAVTLLALTAYAIAPVSSALLRSPSFIVTHSTPSVRKIAHQMCTTKSSHAVNVEGAALSIKGIKLIESFLAATEKGDAAAAVKICTPDFIYKTHRATTHSLAAAEERFHTKVPAPAKITKDLHEESPNTFVREIVVKPIPIVTVSVKQVFELQTSSDGALRISRAEYIKQ